MLFIHKYVYAQLAGLESDVGRYFIVLLIAVIGALLMIGVVKLYTELYTMYSYK